ncbi:hypothetical protein CF386_10495 [Paraphotobacterium marinum]|uniref:Acyltransferase 3 domain-containing protein n=1 Tax=Paraphotobacterium marinum TaxID=1755811 RepID=A0A220VGU8_9GAMM|nr:acyltransferase family protein [Paraphotobacterium marinum]ASK79480.1 hypothetical protein CF386_10495 [Paraphotobacterium marinum]
MFRSNFFIDFFFLISGYFVIPSYLKKGQKLFNKDKIIRLGSVILFTIFIVNYIHYHISKQNDSIGYQVWLFDHLVNLQWKNIIGSSWFCWMLLIFTLIWSQFSKNKSFNKNHCLPLPTYTHMLFFCFFMIPFNFIALLLSYKCNNDFLGMYNIKYFPTYASVFYLGIISYQNKWFDKIDFKYGFFGFILFSFFYCLENGWILIGCHFNNAIFRTFCSVGMILFLLYVFKIYFYQSNKMTRMLSKSSYLACAFSFILIVTLIHFFIQHFSIHPWLLLLLTSTVVIISYFILSISLYRLTNVRG